MNANGTSVLLALALGVGAWSAVPGVAQETQPTTPWPQTLPPQDPTRPAILPNPLDILLRGTDVHPRYRRGDLQSPAFQGLPVLVPPGFGAYPGGQLPVPFRDTGVVSPAVGLEPRSPNSWPTWLPGSREGDEGFTADVAIVVQATDYVWLREPGERVYVPLAYWDRFRVCTAGTSIDVRGGGQFAVVFQRGAVARVMGRARLELVRLDEEASEIALEDVTRLIASAGDRPVRVRVGNSGTIELVATRVSMTRERGMVHVENLGPGDAVFESGDEEVALPSGYRITLLPALPEDAPSGRLALEGDVSTSRDGRALIATGGAGDGWVSWSGARFRLSRGALLRIDPLAGESFPENPHSDR